MDDIISEKVLIEINNIEWEIKYNFQTYVEIEKEFGSLTNMLFEYKNKSFTTTTNLLYKGLKWNSEFVKIYKNSEMLLKVLDSKRIKEYEEKITTAFLNSLPEEFLKKEEEPPLPPQK